MQPRGQKPKPTELKKVLGNPGKRALPKKEAKPIRGIPLPPKFLSGEAKDEWVRVVDELYQAGLLAKCDRPALAAYCRLWARWVDAETALNECREADPVYFGLVITTANGNMMQNPLVGAANKAAADMVRYAVEFGMTPSARSRITAHPPEPEDKPEAEFFN